MRGHWRGFVRMFALPVLLLVAFDVIEGPAVQRASFASATAISKTGPSKTAKPVVSTNSAGFVVSSTNSSRTTTTTVTIPPMTLSSLPIWVSVLMSVAASVSYLTNLAAMCWFGGWMGVTSKNSSLAILKTVAFVLLIPWFCISFCSGIFSMLVMIPTLIGRSAGTASVTSYMVWIPLMTVGVTTLLTIGKDVFFILWARKRLYGSLRQTVTQTVSIPMTPPVILSQPTA